MKSLQTFRTLRSSRDLLKNDVLGSYFKNRVPYPPLISKKTENSGSPTTRKILEKQWILPILGKDFSDLCPIWARPPPATREIGFWDFEKSKSKSGMGGFEIFQNFRKVEKWVLRFFKFHWKLKIGFWDFHFFSRLRRAILLKFRGKSSNFSKNTSKFSPAALKSMNLTSFLKIFARFAQ